ncbi:MAG TPA: GAF domain-containing protein [Planctomycetota bacterium]|jgi:signal transduction histidine kinase/putative methionine-R-sulfoxide reductase with GAF domain
MQAELEQHSTKTCSAVAALAGALTFLGCLIALSGWLLNILWLRAPFPSQVPIQPLTAAALALLGLGLWFQRINFAGTLPSARQRFTAKALAGAVVALAVVSLLSHFTSLLWSGDPDLPAGGLALHHLRASLTSSLSCLLLAVAMVMADASRPRTQWLASGMVLASGAMPFLALVGYLYAGLPVKMPVSFQSSVLIPFMGLGVLCSRPNSGLMAIVTSSSAGGVLARRLFLPALAVPLIVSWLVFFAVYNKYLDVAVGQATGALSISGVLIALVWITCRSLHQSDLQRRKTQSQLEQARNDLEQTVQERTATLLAQETELRLEIATRRQALHNLDISYQNQKVLHDLSRLSLENISLDDQLQRALELILSTPWLFTAGNPGETPRSPILLPKGGIFLVEGSAYTLVLKAVKGLGDETARCCARVPFGYCMCGRAAISGNVEFSSTLDERHDYHPAGMEPHGHYSVPIVSEGQTLGVVVLYVSEGHKRQPDEETFLDAIATTLAGLIRRKQAEENLARQAAVNASLAQLSQALITSASAEDVASLVLRQAKELTQSSCGMIGYVDPSGNLSCPAFATADGPHDGISELCQTQDRQTLIRRSGALWQKLLSHAQPILTNTPQEHPLLAGLSAEDHPVSRLLAVPALIDGRVVGQVVVGNAPRDYTKSDLEVVQRLASLYAIAIQQQQTQTELRTSEENLRRSYARLQEMQMQLIQGAKMAAVGQLAAGVAHEINNPMAVISSSAETLQILLERNKVLQPCWQAIADQIKNIDDSVFRCKNIIDRLLNFSRAETLEQTNLTTLLVDTLPLARSGPRSTERTLILKVCGREISIEPHGSSADLPALVLRTSRHQLQQVLINLLKNAFDATPLDGAVSVVADSLDEGIGISVADTGAGIAPENLAHLFEPFFTTKTVGNGTGLGLYLSHQIISALGGTISVESALGRGTTMKVWLPKESAALKSATESAELKVLSAESQAHSEDTILSTQYSVLSTSQEAAHG